MTYKANHPVYKFVDDSTTFEILHKNTVLTIQESKDQISGWTNKTDLDLTQKTNQEMKISFAKKPPKFEQV